MKNVLHHETERKQADEKGKKVQPHRRKYPRRNRFLGPAMKGTILLGLVLTILGAIFFLNTGNGTTSNTTQTGAYPFVVGKPGPGDLAPAIRLPSTMGKEFDLAAMRGKTVLLFFQEGLGCQSCWTQIQDIEANRGAFRSLGTNTMVSITTNPLDALKKALLDRLAGEYGLSISMQDMQSPEGQQLALQGGFLFPPGVLIENEPFSYGRLSERKLRRELERRMESITHS